MQAGKEPSKRSDSKEVGSLPACMVKSLVRDFVLAVLWKLRFRFFDVFDFIFPELLKSYLVAGVFWVIGSGPS